PRLRSSAWPLPSQLSAWFRRSSRSTGAASRWVRRRTRCGVVPAVLDAAGGLGRAGGAGAPDGLVARGDGDRPAGDRAAGVGTGGARVTAAAGPARRGECAD